MLNRTLDGAVIGGLFIIAIIADLLNRTLDGAVVVNSGCTIIAIIALIGINAIIAFIIVA